MRILIFKVIVMLLVLFVPTRSEAQNTELVWDEDNFTPDISAYYEISDTISSKDFPVSFSFRATKILGHEGFSCIWELSLISPKNKEINFEGFFLDNKKYAEEYKQERKEFLNKQVLIIYANNCKLLYTLTHKSTFLFNFSYVLDDHLFKYPFTRKQVRNLKDFQWSARHLLLRHAEDSP